MERQRDAWDGEARELQLLVPETGAALQALAEPLPARAPSPLFGRLEGSKGPDWLDGQPFERPPAIGTPCPVGGQPPSQSPAARFT